MDLLQKKRELRFLLPSKGIVPTIYRLKNLLIEGTCEFDILILIESAFKEMKRNQQKGVLEYAKICLEENKIRKQLLDLINDLEENDTEELNKNNSRDT